VPGGLLRFATDGYATQPATLATSVR